jgi:hypothetical protein
MSADTVIRRHHRRATTLAAVALAVLVVAVALVTAVVDSSTAASSQRLTFDVAENGKRFVFDDRPLFDDGMPAYGNSFVTEGYLLAAGTLADGQALNADGTLAAEFEDRVIGEWKCFGWFVGDGMRTRSDEIVVTTQTYRFYGNDGRDDHDDRIVSIGTENVVGGTAAIRAITGGTGRHRRAVGEVAQTNLGLNPTQGINATFELDLGGET